MSIPRIIHQLWVTKDNSNQSYPSRYENMRKTLLEHNQDFTFKVWLDKDILALFDDPNLTHFKKVYLKMKYPISKADFARIVLIYTQGGIYIDLDFYGYRPLTHLLNQYPNNHTIITKEFDEGGPAMIYNGFIATYPRNPFFLGFLEYMNQVMSHRSQIGIDVVGTTGPLALHLYAETLPSDDPNLQWREWLIPTTLLLPHNKQGIIRPEVTEEPYVGTLWIEGSKWSTTVNTDLPANVLVGYAIVIPVLILLVIVFVAWARNNNR